MISIHLRHCLMHHRCFYEQISNVILTIVDWDEQGGASHDRTNLDLPVLYDGDLSVKKSFGLRVQRGRREGHVRARR